MSKATVDGQTAIEAFLYEDYGNYIKDDKVLVDGRAFTCLDDEKCPNITPWDDTK